MTHRLSNKSSLWLLTPEAWNPEPSTTSLENPSNLDHRRIGLDHLSQGFSPQIFHCKNQTHCDLCVNFNFLSLQSLFHRDRHMRTYVGEHHCPEWPSGVHDGGYCMLPIKYRPLPVCQMNHATLTLRHAPRSPWTWCGKPPYRRVQHLLDRKNNVQVW